jgi:hypothetical protein
MPDGVESLAEVQSAVIQGPTEDDTVASEIAQSSQVVDHRDSATREQPG